METGISVLIVEDEPMIALMLAEGLMEQGMVATVAHSIDRALSHLASKTFAVAAIDYTLDGATCHPLADRLRAAGIPFVICSGWNSGSLSDEFPGVRIVTKPYRARQVALELTQIVGMRSPQL